MASTFTVKQVVDQHDWQGQHGRFIDYELVLDGPAVPNSTVALTQKPDTPAPSSGDELYGHIEDGTRGPKFRKDQRPDAPQESFNGSQRGKPDEAYWEARNRAIQRQHGQDMALRAIALLGAATPTPDALREAITKWADWFDQDVARVAGQSTAKQDSEIAF